MATLVAVIDPVHSFFKNKIFGGSGDGKSPVFDVSCFSLRLFKYVGCFLFAASAIASSFQLFGNPIHCHIQKEVHLNKKLFETFCWVDGVHTLLEESDAAMIGGHSHGRPINPPAPGVIPKYVWHDGLSIRKHRYYQWVSLVLMAQSLACFFPCFLWYYLEDGHIGSIKKVIKDTKDKKDKKDKEVKEDKEDKDNTDTKDDKDTKEIKDTNDIMALAASFNRNRFMANFLIVRYLFCLGVGILSLVVQMIAVNAFLGGGFFWSLGMAQTSLTTMYHTPTSTLEVVDPLVILFPRLTKCLFSYYAPTGMLQEVDGVCLLPINMLNEKIYLAMWFLFWALFAYSLLVFGGYAILMFYSGLRVNVMQHMMMPPKTDRRLLSAVASLDLGEWFMLCILGNNLDWVDFRSLVEWLDPKKMEDVERGDSGDGGTKIVKKVSSPNVYS